MAYILRLTPRFEKNFQRLTKKYHVLRDRVYNKLSEIRDNPFIGETLSHNLAGMMSTHVGNWVIIYIVEGEMVSMCQRPNGHDLPYAINERTRMWAGREMADSGGMNRLDGHL
jgi:mRNA-degrading endonuclease RelE of RelBE toxin-antitoxin system